MEARVARCHVRVRVCACGGVDEVTEFDVRENGEAEGILTLFVVREFRLYAFRYGLPSFAARIQLVCITG